MAIDARLVTYCNRSLGTTAWPSLERACGGLEARHRQIFVTRPREIARRAATWRPMLASATRNPGAFDGSPRTREVHLRYEPLRLRPAALAQTAAYKVEDAYGVTEVRTTVLTGREWLPALYCTALRFERVAVDPLVRPAPLPLAWRRRTSTTIRAVWVLVQ